MKFLTQLFHRNRLTAALAVVVLLPALVLRGRSAPELTVFAAASLTDVMQELAVPFEKENGVKIIFNFAGSNTLAQQIVAAPSGADVFLSASEKWMDTVAAAGALAEGTRTSVLTNTLVVVAHPASTFSMTRPEDLTTMPFAFLSLGDPDAVPAGKYARQWLSGVRMGDQTVWDAVRGRVSPAPDVRAALAQVESRDDVVGVVYRTDFASAKGRVRLIYSVPSSGSLVISYPAAVMKEAPNPALARRFMDYITSPEARSVFEKYGFGVQ
ncbi:MAG TPA: molybdate ABC transporter substrate-binding protein [Opitutales bacterium]|nr:molybdate ABC transporter substrate-binding protein [Opitutales bacterium]